MIPRYAEPILQARRAGMRPANLVIVSDGIRGLHWRHPDNPVVVVDPNVPAKAYDWRFLAGLDVEIATDGTEQRARALAFRIAKVHPQYLRILFHDSGEMWRVMAFGLVDVRRESDWVCRQ